MDAFRVKKCVAKRIDKIGRFLNTANNRSIKDSFLEKFMLCETACKEILLAYWKEKKQEVDKSSIKLDMKSIPSAMNKAGYKIDKPLLAYIFGSERKRGEKSAKKLRDGIVHSMMIEDMTEVLIREQDLMGRMEHFLQEMSRASSPKHKKNRGAKR